MVTKQQTTLPPQHQTRQPGLQTEMNPQPITIKDTYKGSGKLENRVAIISGGDSGIGRAVAVHFAKEGADVAILYLNEHEDAEETKRLVEQEGKRCLAIAGDIGDETFCKEAVKQTIKAFGKLDIVVNNAAEQHPQPNFLNITAAQLEKTFRTNVFGYFFLTKAALPHLKNGSAIINTASVTAYEGNEQLIDYSATKGAIVAFTRSLAKALVGQGIRVNGVAPGPIWTPLIPSTFQSEQVAAFGANTPMKRPGQPSEVAPCYVFLASDESSYMTGQMLHVNGGKFISD
ncbi:SDR family oxidoreductase [Geobacillus sp. G4]|uniref:Short-chain dehydrogenase n=1 Tax=Geobacillus thermopakistaniensis (strain MAS1) TaxID=1408282 RepID=A0A7U9JB49_GEOTM|nr:MULTISPECIES: SDR family oxidoreductase [Geobacillus]AMV09998.1 NAD(P)-dependent oxidoreductase [Geobacillus thermoleovorans]AOL33602.1 NAD(P)-dependent oxidoreductase [Geobacillus thermoleovorans]ESU72332.1 short-chain dehydrogenase [Geobacillus sp. MAS1]MBW7642269.1 SDR family oxidoreductase [Geobacillus thermoleovorans]ODA17678.1 NAD(P)-dependent oxidoreductase [Geobacillus thermoleovorans]